MTKSIIIIGTLDTKGDQLEYLKQLIEERGHQAIVIDVGVIGDVPFKATISREQIAQASGSNLEEIIALDDPYLSMGKMAEGAARIVKELYFSEKLDGLLAVGGSVGTALALAVMKALPLGVPKLMLTTMAYSPAITPEIVSGDDLLMLPWVAGLWGLNSLSKRVLETAAGAISGAAEAFDRKQVTKKKVIGVTSLGGSTTRYMNQLKPALEERGYDVAVFHATGMSGRIFERAITDGLIVASLDLSVGVELIDHITGGVCSAGEHRLEAAGKMGIPQIVSPMGGAFHWGKDRPLPAKYRDRPQYQYNTLLRIVGGNVEECAAAGKLMAEKLNKARGPTAVVIPMKSVGELSGPRRPDIDSSKSERAAFGEAVMSTSLKGMEALRKALMKDIKPEVKVVVLDASFNDPLYVDTVLALFDEMMVGHEKENITGKKGLK